MSIMIKGMEMPENCEDCSAQIIDPTGGASGCAVNHSIILRKRGEGRPATCPLVEIPPHGDLIDRDALMDDLGIAKNCEACSKMMGFLCAWDPSGADVCTAICDDAPVVIEAEGRK